MANLSIWDLTGKNDYYEWIRTTEGLDTFRSWFDDQYYDKGLKSYLDPRFLDEFRNNEPYSRIWELELARQLIASGLTLDPTQGRGPDFRITLGDGVTVWVEAVLATPDDDLRRFYKAVLGKGMFDFPKEKFTLRYTSVLRKKANKYKEYVKNGLVSENDIKIIAVSGFGYGMEMSSGIEHFLRAIAPIGDPVIHITRDGSPVPKDTPLSSHSNISEYLNKNGSPVPKKFLFPGDEFKHIDGVIFSEISNVQEMLGKHSAYDDSTAKLHLFPNFSAQNTLPPALCDAMYHHKIVVSGDMISILDLEQGRDSSKHGVWL